jgi:MraZ protein
MDRFGSFVVSRLDAKGRVSLPASFRALLTTEGTEGFFAFPSLDFPALDCGGKALDREIEAVLSGFPPLSRERDIYAAATLGAGQSIRTDPEGRFMVTDMMRDVAGIADQVLFLPLMGKFQIWEPEAGRAHQAQARALLRVNREQMGAFPLPNPLKTGASS